MTYGYMIFVEGGNPPKREHKNIEDAGDEADAKIARLREAVQALVNAKAMKEIGAPGYYEAKTRAWEMAKQALEQTA